MKILPILKDCVAAAMKVSKLSWDVVDGNLLITPDGFVLYKLPAADVPISFAKKKRTKSVALVWDKAAAAEDYQDVTRMYMVPAKKKPKRNLMILNDDVAIDTRLMKHFDPGAKLQCKRPIDPVRVYEDGQMVGIILPVRRELA